MNVQDQLLPKMLEHRSLTSAAHLKAYPSDPSVSIGPVIKVKDEGEALRVVNATEYGLSSAVFTRDRGSRFASKRA